MVNIGVGSPGITCTDGSGRCAQDDVSSVSLRGRRDRAMALSGTRKSVEDDKAIQVVSKCFQRLVITVGKTISSTTCTA